MNRKSEAERIQIKPHQYVSTKGGEKLPVFESEGMGEIFRPDQKGGAGVSGENGAYAAYFRRKKILCKCMGLSCKNMTFREDEYLEFDLLTLAQNIYGAEVANYMRYNCNVDQVITSLFNSEVCSLCGETATEQWQVRISLLDMDEDGYAKLGKNLHRLMDQMAVLAKKASYHTRREASNGSLEYQKKW